MNRRFVLGSFALLLGLAGVAVADVAPEPGYVEKCTVERKQQPGTTCQACPSFVSQPPAEKCDAKYAGTKFKKVCQSRGASAWTEVWCDGPPKPESEGGCSLAPPGATSGGLAAWLVGAVLGLLGWRGRRVRKSLARKR